MLNDPPRPEDRPRPEDLPELPSGAEHRAATARLFGAGPRVTPGSPLSTATQPPNRRSAARALVALGLVLALVALAVLTVWQIGGGGDPTGQLTRAQASTDATSPAPTPTPSDTASPSSRGDHPAALDAFYTQQVDWQPCSDNARHECATIEVPVDYARPSGDRFSIALRKVSALDRDKKVGTLIINPGGPGASGLEYAQYASFVFSKKLRTSYDIVGFDPRGIGESDAVSCLSDSDMDLLFSDDPTPDTERERVKLLSDANAITARCAANGGERARHMSTTEVARDMDVMRALAGDQKLNYFGVSYGTFLGAIYADLFPEKVGRFVLDSAMSPNQTDLQEMDYDIQGFESSIDAFVEWCVARADCALGRDKDAAGDRIVDLLDEVENHGLTTSKPGLQTIGEGWVGFAIFMCLYSDTSWPTLNKGLAQAMAGKGDILLAHAMSVVSRSSSGDYDDGSYLHAMIPVRCADWPRMKASKSVTAAQERARREHPLWARLTGELYDNCATWPTAGRTPKGSTLAVGASPILVIGNLRDPATPIGGTKQLAKDLSSGILVTSDHDGHGTYYAGNSCVDSVVDDYLIQGTVPQDGKAC
jgi:pimeloyl-ACP methyl ester carboxylesterase